MNSKLQIRFPREGYGRGKKGSRSENICPIESRTNRNMDPVL